VRQQSYGISYGSGGSFMLRVTTTKTIISDVPRIALIDVNVCHANVMKCFYDVRGGQCALLPAK
jgi:hypothetical protein